MKEATLLLGSSSELGAALAARLQSEGQTIVTLDAGASDPELPVDRAEILLLDQEEEIKARLAALAEDYAFTRLLLNPPPLGGGAADAMQAGELAAKGAACLHLPLACLQAVLPAMRKAAFGRILTFTSFLGLGEPGFSYESARVSSLHSAARTWSLELGGLGITVNALSAGVVDSRESRDLLAQGGTSAEELLRLVPLRRYGRVEDLAEAASFLLSERASYITGQVIHVCGGLTVGRFGQG
ncbi:MAG: SDR family oxidoreductase [Rhodovibrionaceae bacterium]